jgi:hypothetical protein
MRQGPWKRGSRLFAPVPRRYNGCATDSTAEVAKGMKVLLRERDLSEDYIRFAAQVGLDGFDVYDMKRHIPGMASAYAVGYARALLAALEEP